MLLGSDEISVIDNIFGATSRNIFYDRSPSRSALSLLKPLANDQSSESTKLNPDGPVFLLSQNAHNCAMS